MIDGKKSYPLPSYTPTWRTNFFFWLIKNRKQNQLYEFKSLNKYEVVAHIRLNQLETNDNNWCGVPEVKLVEMWTICVLYDICWSFMHDYMMLERFRYECKLKDFRSLIKNCYVNRNCRHFSLIWINLWGHSLLVVWLGWTYLSHLNHFESFEPFNRWNLWSHWLVNYRTISASSHRIIQISLDSIEKCNLSIPYSSSSSSLSLPLIYPSLPLPPLRWA